DEPMDDEPMDDEPMDDEPMDDEPMTSRTWGAYTYEIDFEPSYRGVTDDTVRIGMLYEAAQFFGMDQGAEARFEAATKDGDLPGGRAIELVKVVDDSSNPQTNFEGARSLVENDEVFAILSTSQALTPQTSNYLAENQVPFTGWGFMPGYCAPNDWGLGFTGCASGFAFGVEGAVSATSPRDVWITYFESQGIDGNEITVGVFNADNEAGRGGEVQNRELWGDQMIFSDYVPTATAGGITDPTRFVNTVLENNPDLVILSTDFPAAVALKAAIAASSYEGRVTDYLSYIPGILEFSPDIAQAFEGGFGVTQVPPLDPSEPAIQKLLADFGAVGYNPGFGALIGYWSADLMVQMIAAAGEDLNTASFYQAINIDGFQATQMSGGLGEVKFPADHVATPDCTGLMQVVEGEFVVAAPFICYGNHPDR
ncbi:MAG: ABC transporter substrate-binding protein, partial [bacterium]|nr:ABC transporter substrate-binding protein [bacterium]